MSMISVWGSGEGVNYGQAPVLQDDRQASVDLPSVVGRQSANGVAHYHGSREPSQHPRIPLPPGVLVEGHEAA